MTENNRRRLGPKRRRCFCLALPWISRTGEASCRAVKTLKRPCGQVHPAGHRGLPAHPAPVSRMSELPALEGDPAVLVEP